MISIEVNHQPFAFQMWIQNTEDLLQIFRFTDPFGILFYASFANKSESASERKRLIFSRVVSILLTECYTNNGKNFIRQCCVVLMQTTLTH